MAPAFDLATPAHVMVGRGRCREAVEWMRRHGDRCLLVVGRNTERVQPFIDLLKKHDLTLLVVPSRGEPTFDAVRESLESARGFAPQAMIALGGGSVIDFAKAIAMLLTNGGDPMDYAEVIGRGMPVTKRSLPMLAIPTTAGAGAEATKNAVLIERERGAKVSLRSILMIPDAVIVDPELSRLLPPAVTAATGMDALAQLIEPFVSVKANPLTDALCRAGIPRIARSLERACSHPDDIDAREDMAIAAWWSGVALANAGLGAVHGFAAAIGGISDAPHGLICAHMLAPVCRENIAALHAGSDTHQTIIKYREVAELLTGQANATEHDAVVWLAELTARLPLQPLSLSEYPAEKVIDAARVSSSMKGNPVSLSREALSRCLGL